MTRIAIRGGRLLDPASGRDEICDLYLDRGKVAAIGRAPKGFKPETLIDATGQVVCPGFIDLRARLREPGAEFKATMATELRAAVAGGFTALVCPPDTDPPVDTPATVSLVRERASALGLASVYPLGALTQGLRGKALSEAAALKTAGVVALGNAEQPVSSLVMRQAMEYATTFELPVFGRPEDAELAADGCVHEGALGVRLGLLGIPAAAELIAIERDLALAELTSCKLHFHCLSTAVGVAAVAAAQRRGVPVSADVSAHQLVLTDQAIADFDANYHLRPPLRTEQDRRALVRGVKEGVIAAICSDHQPHEQDAKAEPFARTEPGTSNLQVVLPLLLTLLDAQALGLKKMIQALTCGPARLIGLPVDGLGEGSIADLCVFDPELRWTIDDASWFSAGRNTPFWGAECKGRVTSTLIGGRLVYRLRNGRARIATRGQAGA